MQLQVYKTMLLNRWRASMKTDKCTLPSNVSFDWRLISYPSKEKKLLASILNTFAVVL